MVDESPKRQPKNLREIEQMILPEDSGYPEAIRALARNVTSARAKAQRRRREIEWLAYCGLDAREIAERFLVDPDLQVLLTEFTSERGAQTFLDEVAAVFKSQETKEGEKAFHKMMFDRVQGRMIEKVIKDFSDTPGSSKASMLEKILATVMQTAIDHGAMTNVAGKGRQPAASAHVGPRPADRPIRPPEQADAGDLPDPLDGYEVDDANP